MTAPHVLIVFLSTVAAGCQSPHDGFEADIDFRSVGESGDPYSESAESCLEAIGNHRNAVEIAVGACSPGASGQLTPAQFANCQAALAVVASTSSALSQCSQALYDQGYRPTIVDH